MQPESRARIEALCGQLGHGESVIRAIRSGNGAGALESLTALLKGADEPADAVIKPLLDGVDEAAARSGLQGLTSTSRSVVPDLPVGMISRATTIGWSCPLRRCSRVLLADETDGSAMCAAGGIEMLPYEATP